MGTVTNGNFEVVDDRPLPPSDTEVPPLPSEDSILAFVHHERTKLVKDMCKQGMPQDPKDRVVLLAALKDMSTDALGRKKIQSDEKVGMGQASALISKLLTATPNDAKQGILPANSAPPELGPEVPPPELVEGETDQHAPQQSYESFVAKFGREAK
jgi:hypothetical protein